MYGEVGDEVVDLVMKLFNGEVLDVVGPVEMVPDGDDDEFGQIKVG